MSRDRPVAESYGVRGHHGDDSDRTAWELDRPLREFLDAVDIVAAYIGGGDGERVRYALLSLGRVPEKSIYRSISLPY